MATWNVRTLLDDSSGGTGPRRRTALLAKELARYAVDFAALSETRLSGEGSIIEGDTSDGYTIFWRGYAPGEPRQHGVGLAIRNAHMKNIDEQPCYLSPRLMTLRVPLVKGDYMTIICVYAPTMVAQEESIEEFYDDLDNAIRRTDKRDKILLLGDFNARVGGRSDLWEGVIGPHGVGNMNQNGLRLLSLCSEHDLIITNTLFKLKGIHKTSWMHPRSKQWHLLDYIITRKSQANETLITRAMRGAECWTDHRLILAKMRLKIRPGTRRARPLKKIDCSALRDVRKRDSLERKISYITQDMTAVSSANMSEKWDTFASRLMAAAQETLGTISKKNRDWFTESSHEVASLLQEKNRAHQAHLNNPSSEFLKKRFAELRANAQTQLRGLEDRWWRDLAVEIQGYADTNDMQRFYESTKRIYGPQMRQTAPVRSADGQTLHRNKTDIIARWAEHFDALLNVETPTDHSCLDDLPTLPCLTELDNPPTFEEVNLAIEGLKPRKSPGPDGVPSELLRGGGAGIRTFIHSVIGEIWSGADIPNSWRDALLITIYKNKGDRALCSNSRGIALLGTAGKVLARILLKRLVASVSESLMPETQCGFRSGRSTVDMIFAARQLMEKTREQHRNLYIAFVDLSKAFDSVDRELLWSVLRRCGCPPRFIQIIRGLHDGMRLRVRYGGDVSEPFEVSRGVKQGCVLAPVLFNIYVQCITRLLSAVLDRGNLISLNYRTDRSLFDLQKLKAKTKISQTNLLELQYADDCALVADSAENLQRILDEVSALYTRLGLKINVQKTDYMHYISEAQITSPNLTIDGSTLKKVECFRYLGSNISSNCRVDDEINYRICQATGAYGRLVNRVFKNHNLKLETKIAVYHAVVISALLYGSETWTLYRSQIRSLERFHMSSLRKILGITWKDKVPHTVVLDRTGCVSLESMLNRNLLRWLGHVVRMDDSRLPKQLLYGELTEGRRTTGGQLKRYKDKAKRTLKACHMEPKLLETQAVDRQEWRALSKAGLALFDEDRIKWLNERREKRHRVAQPTGPNFPCPECGRLCQSRIGLSSHVRAHRRRREAEQAVIVGRDGPP